MERVYQRLGGVCPANIPPGARGINARTEFASALSVPCRDCSAPVGYRCIVIPGDGTITESFYVDRRLRLLHGIRRSDLQDARDLVADARARLANTRRSA